MGENAQKAPVLSVQILLPENVNRRLERWTKRMPGASWPTWGGHVTLVPGFLQKAGVEEIRAAVEAVCVTEKPIPVRLAAPLAVPDMTRPDYFAVFLVVETIGDNGEERNARPEVGATADVLNDALIDEPVNAHGATPGGMRVESAVVEQVAQQSGRMQSLRRRLLDALAPLREDLRPQLLEQPFLPHVTLALGLSESEARGLVRELRTDPVTGDFVVDVVWLVTQTFGEGADFARHPIPLGRIPPAELLRD